MKLPKQFSPSAVTASIIRLRSLRHRLPVARRRIEKSPTGWELAKRIGMTKSEYEKWKADIEAVIKQEPEEQTFYDQEVTGQARDGDQASPKKSYNLPMVEFVPMNPEPIIMLPNFNDVEVSRMELPDPEPIVMDVDEYQEGVRTQGRAEGQPSSAGVNSMSERAKRWHLRRLLIDSGKTPTKKNIHHCWICRKVGHDARRWSQRSGNAILYYS